MDATTEPAKPVENYRKKRINYALAGTLLHAGVSGPEIAKRCGAANWNSLRSALHRKGVTARVAKAVTMGESAVTTLTARVARDAADVLRESLGDGLKQAVDALNTKRVSYKDLANDGQGHAAVLKTLAETHRTLYGGAETSITIFGASILSDRADTPQPVVDCVSETISQDHITPPAEGQMGAIQDVNPQA